MATSKWGLISASILYLFSASTGARIAIDEDIPAAFMGRPSRKTPQEDFVRSTGTALSPGVPMLTAHMLMTALAPLPGRIGAVGAVGLIVLALGEIIGMLGEPITYRVLNPRTIDQPKAIVVACNIVLPLLMVLFGIAELSRRRSMR